MFPHAMSKYSSRLQENFWPCRQDKDKLPLARNVQSEDFATEIVQKGGNHIDHVKICLDGYCIVLLAIIAEVELYIFK